jgi:hypothetical protein
MSKPLPSADAVRDADPYVENRPGDNRSINRKLLDLQDLFNRYVDDLKTQLAAERTARREDLATERKAREELAAQLTAERKARLQLASELAAERQYRRDLCDRLCAPVIEHCLVGTHSVELRWAPPPVRLTSLVARDIIRAGTPAPLSVRFSVEMCKVLDGKAAGNASAGDF